QENREEVKPTVLTSVPRLFEKVYEKVQEQIESGTPLRRKIFGWAVRVGMKRYEIYLNESIDKLLLGDPMPPGLRRQWKLAKALVYKKVKDGLGGRIRGRSEERRVGKEGKHRLSLCHASWKHVSMSV